jgi:TolA-binding protein
VCVAVSFTSKQALALFEDADARRAILEIREKLTKLEKNTEQLSEQIESSKQGRLKLANEIEQLNAELSQFRGFGEESQEYDQSFNLKLQKLEESIDLVISRITAIEPQSVIVAGREILVGNLEKNMYEQASELMTSGNYSAAIQLFEKFNKKYEDSSLTAYTLHAKGLAYYAVQAYASAIETLNKLQSEYLNYSRLADAMLTLAASQTEANKVEDAIKTLQTLIARSPSSDAALTARERIKQLKPSNS